MARKSRKEASEVLIWIQRLVRMYGFQYGDHVDADISLGKYDDEDIFECIRNAVLVKRQKNDKGFSTDGWKYIITGPDCSGLEFDTVGKIVDGDNDDNCFFVITAYARR